MKKCPICKRDVTGTKRWYYRYNMCKTCVARLKKSAKIPKYDTW
jgi:hypothetical protein